MDESERIQSLINAKKSELAELSTRKLELVDQLSKLQMELQSICTHPRSSLKSHFWYDRSRYYDEGTDVYHFQCEICQKVTQPCAPDCLAIQDIDTCGEGEEYAP